MDNPVGSVVTKAQGAPGAVKRLSVAVVLDAAKTGVATNEVQQLVENAVGVDPKRGDTVQVSKLPFDTTAAQAAAKQLADVQAAERTAGYLELGKKAGIGLLVLLALMLGWRRSRRETRVDATASDLPASGNVLLSPEVQAAIAAGRLPALGGSPAALGGPLALEQDDAEAAARRDRMRSELAQFVDNQPDEIAQLVQGWLAERKG